MWDDENRLSQVQDNQGNLIETYWYDVDGARVKKTSGNTTTYTFFGHYEEEVTHSVTTAISYYTFGGLRIAVKRGSTLYHLHGDHLGSTSLTTRGSAKTASRADYAYGAERSASGDLKTDHTFNGQKRDATGLMYYNARYYDPALGTFISPDSMVPNLASVIDHNRFLYARGNPLKYADPTGHGAIDRYWEQEFFGVHQRPATGADRTDRLVSLTREGSGFDKSWTLDDWNDYTRNKVEVLTNLAEQAGITLEEDTWDLSNPDEEDNLILLLGGVLEFGYKISTLINTSILGGLAHLRTLIGGGVTWYRGKENIKGPQWICFGGAACALENGRIGFYNVLFYSPYANDSHIQGTAVHELAHKIHFTVLCDPKSKTHCYFQDPKLPGWPDHRLTKYADERGFSEYWAEAVTILVYGSEYSTAKLGDGSAPGEPKQINYIEGVLKQ